MEKGLIYRLQVRWLVCSLGLWIAAGLLSKSVEFETSGSKFWVVIVSGLILALVNSVITPKGFSRRI